MLLELNVKDIALIRRASVEFSQGLNILTGETGAGKSIVIGSIGLVLGAKAKSDIIREGADHASIELIISADDPELVSRLSALSVSPTEEGTIIISRKIGRQRSVSRINDETVTLSTLKAVTALLIDIYGQHEHQTLLEPKRHLEILDAYCGETTRPLREEVKEAFHRCRELSARCRDFSMNEEERLREMDLAAYELREIEEAAIKPGEEEELSARYRRMSHGREIAGELGRAYGLLTEHPIGEALSAVSRAAEFDQGLTGIRDQLFDAESILSGAAGDIRRFLEELDMDEESFRETEERLDLIRSLMAKYGKTEEAIEAYRVKKEERLRELTDYEETRARLEEELSREEEKLSALCGKLTEARRTAAGRLTEAVERELLDLGFDSVSFTMSFREKQPGEDGADEVCFMTALNPGEKEKPLQEVASGGELSRVMLAVKTVLAETDRTPTLIFDEIDTGISGRTAQKVAEKLDIIARRHQVICITHLPQIASMADQHFVISKSEQEGRNVTSIEALSPEESLLELGRLLGGAEITETVMENAAEMKRLAGEEKKMHKKKAEKRDEIR